MWASKLRNQARLKSRINSLHWIDGKCSVSTINESSSNCCGWLLFGGGNGELGASWIGLKNSDCSDNPIHSNSNTINGSICKSHFNLRGHSGGVKFVRWKSQGDQVLSYDGWGNLRVWKNRSNIFASDFEYTTVTPVTDIQWSPCGMYIAICGDEGQLQVISAHNGTTIFAIHAISTNSYGTYAEFTSLSWNKTSTKIVLGTRKGEVIEVDPHQNGQFLSMMTMHENVPVSRVDYFGPIQFSRKVVHSSNGDRENWIAFQSLSLYMEDGEVAMFPIANETHCNCVQTFIVSGVANWNSLQTLLVVVGYRSEVFGTSSQYLMARFVNADANIVLTVEPLLNLPYAEPGDDRYEFSLSSVCWGLQDSVVFVAYGANLFSFDVCQEIPSLKTLCRELVTTSVNGSGHKLHQLPLPTREISILDSTRSSLLQPPFDLPLRDISFFGCHQEQLFRPLPNNRRLHCIMMTNHHSTDNDGRDVGYTLMYEHFGSCIPLLKAFRKQNKGFQQVSFSIELGESTEVRSRQTDWASSPAQTTQRRRNSWSGDIRSRRGSLMGSKMERLKKVVHRLRPRSSVLDAPLEEEPQHDLNDSGGKSRTCTAAGDEDNTDCYPVVAEINGNRFSNKFKILRRSGFCSREEDVVGLIDISSHHITCEPRDVSVTLWQQNQEGNRRSAETMTLQSKKPEWNSRFRVYELDFGGRINRDSVKNFQIESENKIVLQFGRSTFKDYCLDFLEPFSPVTAMGVALAAIHSS